jgi:hypothetical protein
MIGCRNPCCVYLLPARSAGSTTHRLTCSALPERPREVFILCKLDGCKYSEAAERLGISVNNASLDYSFDLFNTQSRVRFGINNVSNERAPLADAYFGFSSDAHSDYGRAYYVDFRVRF